MPKLYSNLKIFHFDSKLKDILTGTLSAPLHIRLKPTNKCNHMCYYCCYKNKNLYLSQLFNSNDEIPRDKMEEIVADLKHLNVKAVTFSGGGEPLCYPYIFETIENFINSGIKVAILTNGSLLTGKVAEILSQGASWVRISMDAADAQTYARIRGVSPKEFDQVCNNIYNFAKMKSRNCQLGVNFIVTKDNYLDVYRFLKLMKKLGAEHVKVSESVVSTKREENEKYCTPFSEPVKKHIAKGILNLTSKNFVIIDKFNELNNNYQKQYTRCPFIQCLVVIAANTTVYTCQDKAYTEKGRLGSIKDKSFRELWLSEETKKKLLNLNPSKECNHHCTQHGKNLILLDYLDVNRSHLEFV